MRLDEVISSLEASGLIIIRWNFGDFFVCAELVPRKSVQRDSRPSEITREILFHPRAGLVSKEDHANAGRFAHHTRPSRSSIQPLRAITTGM